MARGTAALLVLREVFCGTLRTELRSSEVIAQDPAPSPCPAGGVAEPGCRDQCGNQPWGHGCATTASGQLDATRRRIEAHLPALECSEFCSAFALRGHTRAGAHRRRRRGYAGNGCRNVSIAERANRNCDGFFEVVAKGYYYYDASYGSIPPADIYLACMPDPTGSTPCVADYRGAGYDCSDCEGAGQSGRGLDLCNRYNSACTTPQDMPLFRNASGAWPGLATSPNPAPVIQDISYFASMMRSPRPTPPPTPGPSAPPSPAPTAPGGTARPSPAPTPEPTDEVLAAARILSGRSDPGDGFLPRGAGSGGGSGSGSGSGVGPTPEPTPEPPRLGREKPPSAAGNDGKTLEFFGRVARTSTTSSEIGTRVTRPMLIEIELGTYHFREGERITIILDGAAGAQVFDANGKTSHPKKVTGQLFLDVTLFNVHTTTAYAAWAARRRTGSLYGASSILVAEALATPSPTPNPAGQTFGQLMPGPIMVRLQPEENPPDKCAALCAKYFLPAPKFTGGSCTHAPDAAPGRCDEVQQCRHEFNTEQCADFYTVDPRTGAYGFCGRAAEQDRPRWPVCWGQPAEYCCDSPNITAAPCERSVFPGCRAIRRQPQLAPAPAKGPGVHVITDEDS